MTCEHVIKVLSYVLKLVKLTAVRVNEGRLFQMVGMQHDINSLHATLVVIYLLKVTVQFQHC